MISRKRIAVLWASSILAAAPVILTLYLNPDLKIRSEATALLAALYVPYVCMALLLVAISGVVMSLILPKRFRQCSTIPGLPGFTRHCWLAAVGSAALFWLNLWQYRHSVPLETARALAVSSAGISLAALVLLTVGVDGLLFPSRSRGLGAPIAVLASASVLIVPLLLRPPPASPPAPLPLRTNQTRPLRRVVLLGMDGIGWSDLREQVASGNLPAFRTILRRGASGPLATLRPTEGPPIWTTIVTGRFPRDHGVKSFVSYRLWGSTTSYELLPRSSLVGFLQRLGLVSAHPVRASSRRVRALWNALNAFGIDAGIVRLWGMHPVEKVRGFMLSQNLHALSPDRLGAALYPATLLEEVAAKRTQPSDVDRALVSEFIDFQAPTPEPEQPWLQRDLVEHALAPDLTYLRAGGVLRAAYDPPFFATYFFGLDVVGHAFLRYARPELFGDVSSAEIRRYGHVVDRYVAFLGQIVAELEDGLRPGDVLIVISAYGMEPVPLSRRLVWRMTGARELSGTHMGAPDGFIVAVGDGIREDADFKNASVLDVTPTVLYLMGLPVARDMEGRVMTEVLDESFTLQHPISYIPSYESLDVAPPVAETDDAEMTPFLEEER